MFYWDICNRVVCFAFELQFKYFQPHPIKFEFRWNYRTQTVCVCWKYFPAMTVNKFKDFLRKFLELLSHRTRILGSDRIDFVFYWFLIFCYWKCNKIFLILNADVEWNVLSIAIRILHFLNHFFSIDSYNLNLFRICSFVDFELKSNHKTNWMRQISRNNYLKHSNRFLPFICNYNVGNNGLYI